jgi:hypothetical protein
MISRELTPRSLARNLFGFFEAIRPELLGSYRNCEDANVFTRLPHAYWEHSYGKLDPDRFVCAVHRDDC